MADPCPRTDLIEVEYTSIQHFCLLSEDQRSYRSVLTPELFHRHIRFSLISGATSGGQPLISFLFPIVVLTPAAIMNPLFDEAGFLVPVLSHGHNINEDLVTLVEPLEPAPGWTKESNLWKRVSRVKKKRVVSTESNKSIPSEGLMVDGRCASHGELFFRINLCTDPMSRLADVMDRCRQFPLHLSIQWLDECLSKADWRDLRQYSQGLPSLCDTMVRFYQVNS